MIVEPLTSATPIEPFSQTPNATAATQLSSDFEVFLQMLTAQMQYQDPLNPIDSTDYATQLATFSGVEQAVQTNDLLKSLTNQLGVGGLTDLAPWVGKEVRATVPVRFEGEPVTLYPRTDGFADQWEVSVRDAKGEEVRRLTVDPDTDTAVWDGLRYGGLMATDGTYTFQAIGLSNGQIVSEGEVETYARVTEARIDQGNQILVIEGGARIPLSDVTALRES
ncbi:flagellar hook capping FlgD N-terminal domain-containing protein [Yoonia litorea]|uniref:Basal-body rod modification protein FlgD n=1 Tax=Yoonia litorea TaxID=1123755 RepID=A0A1I6MU53_9RHOB|nr:flagellar hook capping FlgD N-terminal domain-containing protein [Yoonia litorea]SFS19167.1 flagellar basal-body rod modification protein FlgD [Yoonia litorea]